MIIAYLKTVKKLSPNGLAIFCGQDDIHTIEPPLPIDRDQYICDRKFHPELIEHLFETHDTYGYLAITDSVLLFKVNGTKQTILFRMDTNLATNTRRGGQSANRLARIRQEKKTIYQQKIVEAAIKHHIGLKALIITGSGDYPKQVKALLESDTRFNLPILGLIKTDNKYSIQDLINKGQDLIISQSVLDEKEYIAKIKNLLRLDSDRLVFGRNEVIKFDQVGQLETIYASKVEKEFASPVIVLSRSGFVDQFDGIMGVLYKGCY